MTTANVTAITEHVAALEIEVRAGFNTVKDRLDKGDKRFGELSEAISDIKGYVTSQQAVTAYCKEQQVKTEAADLVHQEGKLQIDLQRRGRLYEMKLVVVGGLLSIAASGGVQLLIAHINHSH